MAFPQSPTEQVLNLCKAIAWPIPAGLVQEGNTRIFVEPLDNLNQRRGLYRVWERAGKAELTPLVTRWIDPQKEARDLQENEEAIVGEDPEHAWSSLTRTRGWIGAKWEACNVSVMSRPDTHPFSDCSAPRVVKVRFDALLNRQRIVHSDQTRRLLSIASDIYMSVQLG
jgi:hypothetical protein